jgi:hypothetical protein
MQLYIDDELKDDALDADTLDRALMLFKPMGHKRLSVRRDALRRLTLSRWDDEVFIEVETPGRVEGALALDWDEALAAARDYFAGRAARAKLPSLLQKGAAGLVSLVIGAPDDDCPLCRALKEARP